jgi:arylamine N-acetyltransferase
MTRRSALVDEYLQRLNIDVSAPLAPTLATLSAVQRAQTLHVPFENVGMHEQPRIVDATQLHAFGMNAESSLTFPTPLFEKIVRERRGGVCFEQNVLLAWLLDALGFRVEILKAHVNRSLRGAPPTFNMIAPTHVCLRVRIDNCDDAYYVDCGLGPSSLTPLRFDLHGVEQIESPSPDPRRFWRIDNDANAQSITMCGDAGPWITVSYREPTAAEPYFRLWISARPWLSIDEINGALDFIYQSPISWFVLTVIVIRSTERETHVLQNGTLVITDVRTGESTTQTECRSS